MNYNQNDSIYSSVMLGFSKKYTLKSSGCYVFALAHLLGLDPIACHNALKNAGAFMADETGDVCLLNHTKIATAFPSRVVSVAKYDSYDNDACLEAIADNGGCIVKVQNGSYTHFVEFIGNKKIFDSLGGIEKPTSTYPTLLGLRVVTIKAVSATEEYKGYKLDSIPTESLKVMIDAVTDLQKGELVRKAEIDKLQKQIDDLKNSQESLEKIVNELRLSIGEKEKSIKAVTKERDLLIEEKQTWSNSLEEAKKYKGWYEEALKTQVNKYTGSQLISMGLKKIWADRKLSSKK